MAWIKRNKFFVIAMAVGLGCIGYCAYLFANNLSDVEAKNTEYTSDLTQYKNMMTPTAYPSEENVAGATEDIARAKALMTNYQLAFAAFPTPPKVNEEKFKAYLTQTISDLSLAATNAGVGLPDQFAFGFSAEQKELNYNAENLQPWMEQLEQIKAIFAIFYRAKINSLELFQRVKVTDSDDGNASDIFNAQKVTNAPLVATPYKLTFRTFGQDLANLMDGLAQSSNCFIVKTVQVERSLVPDNTTQNDADAQTPPPPTRPVYAPPDNSDPSARRGEPRRFLPQNTPDTPSPPVRRVPRTVLSEGALRVTIAIDAVQYTVANTNTGASTNAAATANTRRAPTTGGGN